jgi:hypothetical protein
MKNIERASKNYLKDKVITDPNELIAMARNRKSFYHFNWGVKPAAILMSMHFSIIMRNIKSGNFWTIKKG